MQPLLKTDLLNSEGKEKPRINQFPTIGYLVTDIINDYNNAIHAGLSAVARRQSDCISGWTIPELSLRSI
jgi:hypothetical protein